LLTFSVAMGLLCSKRARAQAFNLYILFLVLPDLATSVTTTVLASKSISQQYLPWGCQTVWFLASLYSTANFWLNAVIFHEVYTILKCSKRRMRVNPPSTTKVSIQAILCYIFAVSCGVWSSFVSCEESSALGKDYAKNMSRQNFSIMIGTMFFMAVAPAVYVLYLSICIWRAHLLPRSGKTRVLALYVYRIIVFYVSFWLVGITLQILADTQRPRIDGIWYMSEYFMSLQIISGSLLILMKPDVKQAVWNLWTLSPLSAKGSLLLSKRWLSSSTFRAEGGSSTWSSFAQSGTTGSKSPKQSGADSKTDSNSIKASRNSTKNNGSHAELIVVDVDEENNEREHVENEKCPSSEERSERMETEGKVHDCDMIDLDEIHEDDPDDHEEPEDFVLDIPDDDDDEASPSRQEDHLPEEERVNPQMRRFSAPFTNGRRQSRRVSAPFGRQSRRTSRAVNPMTSHDRRQLERVSLVAPELFSHSALRIMRVDDDEDNAWEEEDEYE